MAISTCIVGFLVRTFPRFTLIGEWLTIHSCMAVRKRDGLGRPTFSVSKLLKFELWTLNLSLFPSFLSEQFYSERAWLTPQYRPCTIMCLGGSSWREARKICGRFAAKRILSRPTSKNLPKALSCAREIALTGMNGGRIKWRWSQYNFPPGCNVLLIAAWTRVLQGFNTLVVKGNDQC